MPQAGHSLYVGQRIDDVLSGEVHVQGGRQASAEYHWRVQPWLWFVNDDT